jgi:hypothetical protein
MSRIFLHIYWKFHFVQQIRGGMVHVHCPHIHSSNVSTAQLQYSQQIKTL